MRIDTSLIKNDSQPLHQRNEMKKWKMKITIIFNLPTFRSCLKDIQLIYSSVCARVCEDLKWSIFTYDVVQCNKKILQLRTISELQDLYLDHPSMVVKVVKSNHSYCNKTMLNWLLQLQLCSNLIKWLLTTNLLRFQQKKLFHDIELFIIHQCRQWIQYDVNLA